MLRGQGSEENEAYSDSKKVSDSGETTTPLEQGWDQNKRRSMRRKRLVEILKTNHSALKASSRKCSKRLPQHASRTEGQQKLRIHQLTGRSSLGIEVRDSHIINMIRILYAQEPQSLSQNLSLSPRKIWGFLTKLGVTGANSDEEVIRVIADIEERDQKRYTNELQDQRAAHDKGETCNYKDNVV
ncbi:hypothetical protein Ancab_013108 [Ancistrocladus abbreviatus]